MHTHVIGFDAAMEGFMVIRTKTGWQVNRTMSKAELKKRSLKLKFRAFSNRSKKKVTLSQLKIMKVELT